MDGRVVFNSLDEGINELKSISDSMHQPIDNFKTEQQKIGEDGSVWGGTAASKAAPVLNKIEKNVEFLQSMIIEFANNTGVALKNYAEAEHSAESAMNELDNIAPTSPGNLG